jgi:hypothetical protein
MAMANLIWQRRAKALRRQRDAPRLADRQSFGLEPLGQESRPARSAARA